MTNATFKARHGALGAPAVSVAVADDLAALVCAITRGDQGALANLYNQSVGKAYSLALRIVRSKECAQEVVCDVFLEVWRNARTYDPRRGSVQAWLNVITRNRAIDRVRGNLRHLALSHKLFGESSPIKIPQPEELLASFQECSSVHAALSQLSPLKRMFVALSFFDGLTHEEIAAGIGVPLGTVKSHVRRALRSLREALGGLPSRPHAFAGGRMVQAADNLKFAVPAPESRFTPNA